MLRHSAGYALIKGKKDLRRLQEWLGHRSLASTARYTALDVDHFAGIWDYALGSARTSRVVRAA